ncbi:MAG: hypothetical protein AABW90_03150 [Nanoarchaeota archaeon]
MSVEDYNIENSPDGLAGHKSQFRSRIGIIEYKNFYDTMLIKDFGEDYLNKIREDIKLRKSRR